MRILIDLDSTVVDLLGPWLEIYNQQYDDNIQLPDISTFKLHDITKKAGKDIYAIIERDGFFESLPALPGAIEAVRALHDDGHEIHIVSDCPFPEGKKGKGHWFAKHLSFIPKGRLWIGGEKACLKADALIDDGPHNADAYRKAHPEAFLAGIAFPYNAECKSFDLRAEGYHDTEDAWAQIVAAVRERAKVPAAPPNPFKDFWGSVFLPQIQCSIHKVDCSLVAGHLTCPVCVPWVRTT